MKKGIKCLEGALLSVCLAALCVGNVFAEEGKTPAVYDSGTGYTAYLNGHCFVSVMLCVTVWNQNQILYVSIPLTTFPHFISMKCISMTLSRTESKSPTLYLRRKCCNFIMNFLRCH